MAEGHAELGPVGNHNVGIYGAMGDSQNRGP